MANIKTSGKSRSAVIGLSGGVDSSLTAALLKEKGDRVFGRYLKGYAPPGILCPEENDIRDARAVARVLGIDFKVENAGSKLYQERVYKNFLELYFDGKTPNPDVSCNRFVKFPLLKDLMGKYHADYMATGHFFRKIRDRFFMARDRERDQSYFLWEVPRELLSLCEFPIGEFTKEEVREMARSFNLPVADKPGTRGVCMVGDLSIPEALEQAAAATGKELSFARAVLVDGNKEIELGKIPGHIFFAVTIGQRNGFGISYKFPIYLVKKDISKMTLYFAVMPRGRKSFMVSETNWLAPDEDSFNCPMHLLVKIRTPGKMLDAKLVKHGDNSFEVLLDDPDPGIAPGQSAVFYRKAAGGDVELLGGGVIQ